MKLLDLFEGGIPDSSELLLEKLGNLSVLRAGKLLNVLKRKPSHADINNPKAKLGKVTSKFQQPLHDSPPKKGNWLSQHIRGITRDSKIVSVPNIRTVTQLSSAESEATEQIKALKQWHYSIPEGVCFHVNGKPTLFLVGGNHGIRLEITQAHYDNHKVRCSWDLSELPEAALELKVEKQNFDGDLVTYGFVKKVLNAAIEEKKPIDAFYIFNDTKGRETVNKRDELKASAEKFTGAAALADRLKKYKLDKETMSPVALVTQVKRLLSKELSEIRYRGRTYELKNTKEFTGGSITDLLDGREVRLRFKGTDKDNGDTTLILNLKLNPKTLSLEPIDVAIEDTAVRYRNEWTSEPEYVHHDIIDKDAHLDRLIRSAKSQYKYDIAKFRNQGKDVIMKSLLTDLKQNMSERDEAYIEEKFKKLLQLYRKAGIDFPEFASIERAVTRKK